MICCEIMRQILTTYQLLTFALVAILTIFTFSSCRIGEHLESEKKEMAISASEAKVKQSREILIATRTIIEEKETFTLNEAYTFPTIFRQSFPITSGDLILSNDFRISTGQISKVTGKMRYFLTAIGEDLAQGQPILLQIEVLLNKKGDRVLLTGSSPYPVSIYYCKSCKDSPPCSQGQYGFQFDENGKYTGCGCPDNMTFTCGSKSLNYNF